ncbi:MAG: hypothetical protein OHK0011_08410 [Turneriella sp.]
MQLGGHRTYSDAVNQALAEYIRIKTLGTVYRFAGSDIWQGDLPAMRDDENVSH